LPVGAEQIDTFPSEYPYNRTRYDEGYSVYSVQELNSTNSNWSNFGYSSFTQSTGSDGWIFWQTSSSTTTTTTTTTTTNTADINEQSFSKGIAVSAWGIGQFPIEFGQCKLLNLRLSLLSSSQILPFHFG
jgi:hypothetical protein